MRGWRPKSCPHLNSFFFHCLARLLELSVSELFLQEGNFSTNFFHVLASKYGLRSIPQKRNIVNFNPTASEFVALFRIELNLQECEFYVSAMATKLYYAVPPLASSDKTSTCFVLKADDLSYSKAREREQSDQNWKIIPGMSQNCMDGKPERQKMESIGKTMQMHEAIFKHQVSELHRLYKVQRMLMDEVNKQIQYKVQHWSATMAINSGFHVGEPKNEPTGSYSGETTRIRRGFDLERPAEEDIVSAEANRSNNTNNHQLTTDGLDDEQNSDVELTLSIGGSSRNKKRHRNSNNKLQNHIREIDSSVNSLKSDQQEDCRSGSNTQ